jgi:preprotein translocase subunit SecF
MELIRPDINIDFVGHRHKAFVLSAVLILLGLVAMVYRGGLNLGVDFAGGTLIQVKFNKPTSPDEIRDAFKDMISQTAVQQVGASSDNEYLLRTDLSTTEMQNLSQAVEENLKKAYGEGNATVLRVEMVGPKVGHDLRQKALFAIYYSLLLMSVYISGRFELKWTISGIMAGVMVVGVYFLEAVGINVTVLIVGALVLTLALCWVLKLPYALGAVLCLIHDVLITVGAFAITDKEISLEVLAAVLTLVGFSLNDTIVIFDRIRENLRKSRGQDFREVVNLSINQTLSRSIITSGTVFIVVACLFFLGGTVIHDFSFALLIGIIAGSYSTIFVASPLLILFEDLKKKKGKPSRKRAASTA